MTSSRLSSNEDTDSKRGLNFSIEHILNRAGNLENSERIRENSVGAAGNLAYVPFPWLQCTRYCPPKIPRNQRRDIPQKRQLGRHPRIPFTTHQLTVLEEKFKQSAYLSSAEVKEISRQLNLVDIRVKIWFQNRRARERREKSYPKEVRNDRYRHTVSDFMTESTISGAPLSVDELPCRESSFSTNGVDRDSRTLNFNMPSSSKK